MAAILVTCLLWTEKQVQVQVESANNILLCISTASVLNRGHFFLSVIRPGCIADVTLDCIKDMWEGGGFPVAKYMKCM